MFSLRKLIETVFVCLGRYMELKRQQVIDSKDICDVLTQLTAINRKDARLKIAKGVSRFNWHEAFFNFFHPTLMGL